MLYLIAPTASINGLPQCCNKKKSQKQFFLYVLTSAKDLQLIKIWKIKKEIA